MKCQYCGKELSDSDKYCDFCGAKVKEETQTEKKLKESADNANTESGESTVHTADNGGSPTPKNTSKGWKIVIIVILVSAFFSTGLVVTGGLLFKTVFNTFSDTFEDFDFDFDDDFDFDFDFDSDFDSGVMKANYEGADKFVKGETDVSKNSYASEFSGIDFSLPAYYETYKKSDIADMYEDYGIDKDEYKNNLVIFDFFSENSISGTTIEIDYYNKDYYSNDYSSLDDYNKYLKDDNCALEYSEDCKVSYAEDSVINLDGNEYNQLAARISMNGVDLYVYNFTREVNGYYMDISVVTYNLDDVSEFIKAVNGEIE